MKDKILAILSKINKDIDEKKAESLIGGGFLDSFQIIEAVSEIEAEFDIELSADDITEANFQSLSTLAKLVETLARAGE